MIVAPEGKLAKIGRISVGRTAISHICGTRALVGRRFDVHGARNISNDGPGRLELGLMYRGFALRRQRSMLRVDGTFRAGSAVRVGQRCQWHVMAGGVLDVGARTYFSPGTTVVASQLIKIGNECAIGWDCQFMDSDLHTVIGRDRGAARSQINIGDHVWIGARSIILPGTRIGHESIVAAGSVVRGVFDEPNVLLAGTPARVVRRDIHWE